MALAPHQLAHPERLKLGACHRREQFKVLLVLDLLKHGWEEPFVVLPLIGHDVVLAGHYLLDCLFGILLPLWDLILLVLELVLVILRRWRLFDYLVVFVVRGILRKNGTHFIAILPKLLLVRVCWILDGLLPNLWGNAWRSDRAWVNDGHLMKPWILLLDRQHLRNYWLDIAALGNNILRQGLSQGWVVIELSLA